MRQTCVDKVFELAKRDCGSPISAPTSTRTSRAG